MKATLRTYSAENTWEDRTVDIDDAHQWADGPYADTVPFTVSSNQTLLPCGAEDDDPYGHNIPEDPRDFPLPPFTWLDAALTVVLVLACVLAAATVLSKLIKFLP